MPQCRVVARTTLADRYFERKPDKPVIGGGELRKENLFLSKAFELGRKITPADEERIWAEIEAECD